MGYVALLEDVDIVPASGKLDSGCKSEDSRADYANFQRRIDPLLGKLG